MSRQIVQTGDLACSTGGGVAGGIKVFLGIPQTVDCPIEQRVHDLYDLNDKNASLGDMDPVAFSGLLADGPVINGYKTYQKNAEGIEQTYSLVLKKGGDNAVVRRMEALSDDVGGLGGDILTNLLLIIVSTIDGVSPTMEKTRVWKAQVDAGVNPNTGKSSEAAEYSYDLKLPGRPMVYKEGVDTLVNDTLHPLTVTDTLAYDADTKTISGVVTVAELANHEATASVEMIDSEERDGIFLTGSNTMIDSTDGTFAVNMLAPTNVDTKNIDVSVNISGITVLSKKITIPSALVVGITASDIAQSTAKATITVTDGDNKLKGGKLDYEIVDVAQKKVVKSGKVTSGTEISVTGLKPGTVYRVETSFNGLPVEEKEFTTTK